MDNATSLGLALELVEAAREQLSAYAVRTDESLPGTVDAADHLDVARDLLAKAGAE